MTLWEPTKNINRFDAKKMADDANAAARKFEQIRLTLAKTKEIMAQINEAASQGKYELVVSNIPPNIIISVIVELNMWYYKTEKISDMEITVSWKK